jgi:hypothetical protein
MTHTAGIFNRIVTAGALMAAAGTLVPAAAGAASATTNGQRTTTVTPPAWQNTTLAVPAAGGSFRQDLDLRAPAGSMVIFTAWAQLASPANDRVTLTVPGGARSSEQTLSGIGWQRLTAALPVPDGVRDVVLQTSFSRAGTVRLEGARGTVVAGAAEDPQPTEGRLVFTKNVLPRVSAPVSSQNLTLMDAWMTAESGADPGGPQLGGCAYNPLNTEQTEPGSTDCNDAGVQSFPDLAEGEDATVTTLLNGNFNDNILPPLQAGTCAVDVADGIADSGWGTGNLVLQVLAGWAITTCPPSSSSQGGTWQAGQAASQDQNGIVDAAFEESSTDNYGLGVAQYTPTSAGGDGWAQAQNLSGGAMASEPSTIASSPGTVNAFWEGQNGDLYHDFYNNNGPWSGANNLGYGPMGGPPQAVADAHGDIWVFWKATGNQLRMATYQPGNGWSKDSKALGGDVGSIPAPVVTKTSPTTGQAETITVVYTDLATGDAAHIDYFSNTWHSPSILTQATNAGQPAATGQTTGTIDVVYKNTQTDILDHIAYTPIGGWATTANPLSTTTISDNPIVVSSKPGTVDTFWLQGTTLYRAYIYTGAPGWSQPVAMTQMGTIGSEIFATSQRSGTINVFWKGATGGALWHTYDNTGQPWANPTTLGGNVN